MKFITISYHVALGHHPMLLLLGLVFLLAIISHTSVTRVFSFLKRRPYAWAYLLSGPSIVQRGFDQSHGKPYEVHAPDTRMVFVSSAEYINELNSAPDSVLSLNGAAKHMLQPLYTMNGFNWFDRRGVEGIFVLSRDHDGVNYSLKEGKTAVSGLLLSFQTIHAPVYPMMMNVVVLLNARSLFGNELIKDEKFMASALGYVEETLLNAEIVKLLPEWLAPTVGRMLSHCLGSHKAFFQRLMPSTELRLQEQSAKNLGQSVPKRADCIQWIIETAPKQTPWSAERVIYELMAIWFGSVHILSTTIVYAVHDLCLHPEYLEPLRKELEVSYEDFVRTGQGLPLLDSFVKESARLTPVESMSVRRCALQPFSLSDGTQLAVGEWACAPSGAINTSANHYPSPNEFSGFRFVKPEDLPAPNSSEGKHSQASARQPAPSKLTDVDHSFLMWGIGRMACSGRYYASAFMKLVLAELILNYDFTLADPAAPRWISWRVARIPRPWAKVVFTTRA